MNNVLKDCVLKDKEPAIVTDKVTNMVHAGKLMGFFPVSCFSHVLKLASWAALKLPAVTDLLG